MEKTYKLMQNVGTCKYLINYITGTRFNTDGSLQVDIHLESNKQRANRYVRNLIKQGYSGNGLF